MPNHATKLFFVVGALRSPNAVVLARDEERARKKYNRVLSKHYNGKEDNGVGVFEVKTSEVVFLRGGSTLIYSE